MRRVRRWLPIVLIGLSASACNRFLDPEDNCRFSALADVTAATALCDYAAAISEGDRNIDTFRGKTAVDNYARALAFAQSLTGNELREVETLLNANRSDLICRAAYGQLIGNVQELLRFLNDLLDPLIRGAVSLANGDSGGSSSLSKLLPAQSLEYELDFGDQIANYYAANLEDPFDGIAAAHEILETIPDCEYLATNDHNLAFNPNAFATPGVPIRLGSNLDPTDRKLLEDPDALLIQIRTGRRWDLSEARVIRFVVELIRGIVLSVAAHDLTINDAQLTQLTDWILKVFNNGSNLLDMLECGTIVNVPGISQSSPYYGQPIDSAREAEADDANPNGRVDTPGECALAVADNYTGKPLSFWLRRLGFLMDDPRTFDRDENRWEPFIRQVDNALAASFGAMAPLPESLVRRTVRHGGRIDLDEILAEYSFIFDDQNNDGVLNRGDRIGFSIEEDIQLKIPDAIAELAGINPGDLDGIKDVIRLLLPQITQQTIPSDEFVVALGEAISTLRDQFASVDDPTVQTQLFRMIDLQPIISATFFFGSDPFPDVLAFDFGKGLAYRPDTDPAGPSPLPLRAILPYWEVATATTPQGASINVNEFIIEEEIAPSETTQYAWQTTGDTTHFRAGVSAYTFRFPLDPDLGEVPQTFFVDGPPAPLPADCEAPQDQAESGVMNLLFGSSPGLMYLYLQNPSFNGAMYVKIPSSLACPGDPSGFSDYAPADLYTAHRAMIEAANWFNENFSLTDLLSFAGGG
ncbi:MAG: hypothetical protein D6761_05625 [Candidatus Dadabacteria bacterium]|nr:MAG: hypothetical protein D6761_05625 [Candidatus Dadabacteria bacterium]